LHYFSCSANADGTLGEFNLWGQLNTRRRTLVGDMMSFGEQYAYVGLDYRNHGLRVGFNLMHRLSKDTWKYKTVSPSLYNITGYYTDDSRNILSIQLSYSFDFGRQKAFEAKRLYNEDYDKGVM
jgi:hypothetical protein